MNNSVCKKVVSMLALYIENKLDDNERLFVENHFAVCPDCYQKFLEMKEIIGNLHYEYKKLLNEFERIEANKIFNIREYEMFYKNISPYIDDELCYDESIKFRKYLLKSKPARAELASAYGLKNSIKNSVATYKDNLNINFPKKIVNMLKEENKDSFENVYKRAALVLGFMITALIIASVYMGFNYFNQSVAHDKIGYARESFYFPYSDDEMVEFSFDGNEVLLSYK